MTFEQSVDMQPLWVQYWTNWMGLIIVVTAIVLLFSKQTRRDSLWIVVSSIAILFAMGWLFNQLGFVRLLGVVHLIIWTPLAVYFWTRLKEPSIGFPFRQFMWTFLATITISLMFDFVDTIRYVLGEQASMVPNLS